MKKAFLSYTAAALLFVMAFDPAYSQNVADWKFESQRPEIAPSHAVDRSVTFEGGPTLSLSGGGKDFSAGHWYTMVTAEPGMFYRFRTHFRSFQVEEPQRTILARVIFQDEAGKLVGFREYPATLRNETKDGWSVIEQSYQAPEGAHRARLELQYRWDGDGRVHFGNTTFERTTAPEKRMVRLAAVHHRPRDSKSSMDNLLAFGKLIAQAGAQKADIVCLPEGVTIVGTQHDYISASEPIPGPTTKYLGEMARKHKLYIVAGILEKDGEVVYNTAVLIDRDGKVAGKYRKTSLPREEIDGGITPGNSFPVFDTDFGRIGMMICWDVTFPEPARLLAEQGAEVIFLPIWGGDLTLAKARAIENQVYLVSSTYDMVTGVFDLEGNIMDQADRDNEVVIVDVDLNAQKLWPWLGDFKNRIPRERPSKKAVQNYQTVSYR